jgi:heme/copper-type cytochrome/quinol oxidase subunit 2
MNCSQCGQTQNAGTAYCINCGTALPPQSQPEVQMSEQQPIQQPTMQQPQAMAPMPVVNSSPSYNNQPGYNNNQGNLEEPVTFGDWMVTYLLMMIPVVGTIMMFVWAFGSGVKKSKSNYFKAVLLWIVIMTVVVILINIIFIAILGVAFDSLMSGFENAIMI